MQAQRSIPDPVLAALITLLLSVVVVPGTIPDGPEMAAAGKCLLSLGFHDVWCAGAEPLFWMPAFPTLAGLLSFVATPWAASHAAAALAAGLLVVPLAKIGRYLGVPAAGLIAAALLLALPPIRDLVAHPSGRGLGWLCLVSAIAASLPTPHDNTPRKYRAVTIGVLLGLAVLSRRELIVQVAVVVVALLRMSPRRFAPAALIAVAMTAGWGATLSIAGGTPRLGARAWEPAIYAWSSVVPHEWLLMEVSMGTWGTPLRRAVSGLSNERGLTGLEPSVLVPWLRYALPVAVPVWFGALAAAGSALLFQRREGRLLLAGAALLALPALPLSMVPNARTVAFPAQNLHALLFACFIPALYAVGRLFHLADERWSRGRQTVPVVTALIIGTVSYLNHQWVRSVVPTDELSTGTLQSAGALLPNRETPVYTTLSSAPAVRNTHATRLALPSAYRLNEPSTFAPGTVLLSDLDLSGARRTLTELSTQLRPTGGVQQGDAWALWFEATSETAAE